MSKMQRLLALAKSLKVRVHFRKTLGNYNGVYRGWRSLIIVRKGGRSKKDILYTLSHEIGHAFYDHGGEPYEEHELYDRMFEDEIIAWNYASRLAKNYGFFNKSFVKHRNRSIELSAIALKEDLKSE